MCFPTSRPEDARHLACACVFELSRVYAQVLNAYARVARVAVSRVYVWVLNMYAWVLNEYVRVLNAYVRVLNAYARVSRVAVSRAHESGQTWGGSLSQKPVKAI